MDDTNWGRALRASLAQARVEAKQAGSRTLDAEHLLLALAAEADGEPARLLAAAGLDYDRLTDALRTERRQSLAHAGIQPGEGSAPRPTDGTPVWATSAKEALLRGKDVATRRHRSQMGGTDVLVGILRADLGTVPRALEFAGVDRAALLERAARTVGAR
ncbi:hypothetical protein GCM10027052_25900 [Parafrigoribacterium mesophilum]|uniref:Clp protease N-terminal domain-containing protein n=1 Tax=Parafrigoribacterium mesophilum TaxID=433646 RepID=UPI0031FDF06E